jgi:hypothetical protein
MRQDDQDPAIPLQMSYRSTMAWENKKKPGTIVPGNLEGLRV